MKLTGLIYDIGEEKHGDLKHQTQEKHSILLHKKIPRSREINFKLFDKNIHISFDY